ncbi:MAG: extracellular solute-binding protein, partial [Firmicutes bacterium]|nr:extracellular solute-binding protein [Bacillota bacterium]
MKKNLLTSIAAAILAAIAIAALSACGGNAANTAAQPTAQTKAATTAAPPTAASAATTAAAVATVSATTAAATPDTNVAINNAAATTGNPNWNTPYTDTVTVTIANDESPSFMFAPGESITDNLWTRRWKQTYNVEVKTLWTSSDYATKLNLAIASQDLPDMFRCDNVQFQQILQAGLAEDLTDAYNKMASPGIVSIMSKDPEMVNTAFSDGRMYGMPRLHYGYECQPNYVWVRKDWYEQAGKPEIKTVDQFEALMRTFKQQHNTAYAISCDKYLEPFFYMAAGFHAYPRDGYGPRMWVDDGNGGIMSGYEMIPQMKSELTAWAKWYKDGLVRPDFTDLENSDMVADIVSGKTGLDGGPQWDGWAWTDVVKNFGNEAYLEPHDLPSIDGQTVMYPISFINDGYNVVRKGAKNADILIKLIDDYAYVLNEATITGGMTSEQVLPFTSNNMHHTTGPFKILFRSYDDVKQVIDNV